MNLDEAIQSFKDEMEKQTVLGHPEHIDNLEQMSEWLKELKAYREQSGDAISRQAVLNAMYDLCDTEETLKENPWRDNPHIDAIIDAIDDLPSVTPQQRTGRWIKQNYGWNWQCSECGFVTPPSAKEIFTFCPKCGVKMEVEE